MQQKWEHMNDILGNLKDQSLKAAEEQKSTIELINKL
jgi:hypothetical protein